MLRNLIKDLLAETQGQAIFRGHSPYDSYLGLRCGHVDHCVIGNALLESFKDREIADLKFYRIGHLLGGPYGQECNYLTADQWSIKQAMRKEYSLINRAVGRYGIAGQSVSGAWYQTARQPECADYPK